MNSRLTAIVVTGIAVLVALTASVVNADVHGEPGGSDFAVDTLTDDVGTDGIEPAPVITLISPFAGISADSSALEFSGYIIAHTSGQWAEAEAGDDYNPLRILAIDHAGPHDFPSDERIAYTSGHLAEVLGGGTGNARDFVSVCTFEDLLKPHLPSTAGKSSILCSWTDDFPTDLLYSSTVRRLITHNVTAARTGGPGVSNPMRTGDLQGLTGGSRFRPPRR